MSSLSTSPVTTFRDNRRGTPLPTSIAAFLRLLWIEIKRAQGYWVLPLMLGLGVYTPSVDHWPEIALWPAMSQAIFESHVPVGALAAGLGAWLAGRENRRRIADLLAATPGTGIRRDLLTVGATIAWSLLGYGGVALWFGGQGVFRADWGGPNPGLIAVGALGVAMLATVGVLVGRLLPGRFGPLVAVALGFGLTIAAQAAVVNMADGSRQSPVKYLMPIGLNEVAYSSVFLEHRQLDSLITEVSLWMLAVTVLLIAVLAMMRARTMVTAGALAATAAVAVAAAMPLVGVTTEWGPTAYVPVAYTPVCQERDGFEVCVHPAFRGKLDETAHKLDALLDPVEGLEGVSNRWDQVDPRVVQTGEEPGQFYDVWYDYGLLGAVASVFPAGDASHGQRSAAQLVIMEWLVAQSGLDIPPGGLFGWPAEVTLTHQEYGESMVGFGPDEAEMAPIQAAMDAAQARFAALPADERRSWLETNWGALRAGELTLEDLP